MSTALVMPRDVVFDATVIAADGPPIARCVPISARRAKRGDGDGQLWRGVFVLPPESDRRPFVGDSVFVEASDGLRLSAVVTEVAGRIVQLRARGRMPPLLS
jgi:hypothetical protein